MSRESDSDTGSLPDLSQIIPRPPASIAKGDIVWAKFKHLYWPALVRSVYTKQKKISIWYADEPGKTFKLPLKNVCYFHDAKMRVKIEKDVREAGCVREHEGLTSHATRYLTRKSQGYVDDPMKFFDQTYPFFLMEDFIKKNPDAEVSNIKIAPLYISRKNKNIRKTVNVRKGIITPVDSEVESAASEDESNTTTVPIDYLSKVQSRLRDHSSDTSKDEYIDKIVEFVKSGKADDHLQKILSKSIPSEHSQIYEELIKSNKRSISHLTCTGPVEDDEKLRELIFYLLPLHDRMTNIIANTKRKHYPTRQRKMQFLQYSSFEKKNDGAQYVASVWLPESIICAISNIYNVSLSEAKKLFRETSESKTKELGNILASLSSVKANNNSEIKKESVPRNTKQDQLVVKHESDLEMSSPLKKLRSSHKIGK